jgi:hypothetical protein
MPRADKHRLAVERGHPWYRVIIRKLVVHLVCLVLSPDLRVQEFSTLFPGWAFQVLFPSQLADHLQHHNSR